MTRLYGITHGGSVNFGGVPLKQTFVYPTFELQRELESLPQGSTVGVEYFSELVRDGQIKRKSIKVDGKKVSFDEPGRRYWNFILNTAALANLEVIYLDDMEAMRAYVRKLMESNKRREEFSKLLERKGIDPEDFVPEHVDNELMETMATIHRIDLEARYIYEIGREERIIERILETTPETVILGRAHAEYAFSQREELEKRGLIIDGYAVEEPEMRSQEDAIFLLAMDHEVSTPSRFVRNPEPHRQTLVERDSLIRHYNAATRGRIFPGRTPQFIGTWRVNLPAAGLFEVYVTESKGDWVGGSIEDTFGTAVFTGAFKSGGRITFLKAYDKDAIIVGGHDGPLLYNGTLQDGRYEGTYQMEGPREMMEIRFWMRPL